MEGNTGKGQARRRSDQASFTYKLICVVSALALVLSLVPWPATSALATEPDETDEGAQISLQSDGAEELSDGPDGPGSDDPEDDSEEVNASEAEKNADTTEAEGSDTEGEEMMGQDALNTDSSTPSDDEESGIEIYQEEVLVGEDVEEADSNAGIMLLSAVSSGATLKDGDEITQGGTYYIAASSTGTITVQTSEKITLRQASPSTQITLSADLSIVYADGVNGSVTLSGLNINMSGNITKDMVHFADGTTNTLTLSGTNYFTGAKSGRYYPTNTVIAVPSSSILNVTGTGSLFYYGSAMTSVILIGGPKDAVNGQINLGTKGNGQDGPHIGYRGYSSSGANVAIGFKSNATAVTGDPGAINFNSGVYELSGRPMVGGNATGNRQFKVSIASGCAVTLFLDTSLASSPYTVPFGGGLAQNSTTSTTYTYHSEDPASGGTLTVELGALLRCATNQNLAFPTGQPFTQDVPYNIICMNIQSTTGATDTSLIGTAIDFKEFIDKYGFGSGAANVMVGDGDGNYYYSIDDGPVMSFTPDTESGDTLLAPSGMSWTAKSIADKGYLLPFFLTPEKHTISFYLREGPQQGVAETITLYYNEADRCFTVNDAKYGISYDLNNKDVKDADLLYTPQNNAANPSEVSISGGAVDLLDPTCEGYDFAGWYTSEGLKVAKIDASELNGNITLTAHWEPQYLEVSYPFVDGGRSSSMVQYGKAITVDGAVESTELKAVLSIPDLDASIQPEEGFTTIGYQALIDEDGNLNLTLRSGMPAQCKITIEPPEKGCDIWVVVNGIEHTESFSVPNGTEVNFLAYPDDGYVFEYFEVDGAPYKDEAGNAAYTMKVTNHIDVSAKIRVVKYLRASIAEDATATLIDDDANAGWRLSENGVRYQITKTGTRFVQGKPQYVTGYPVYDGDPLYEDDVLMAVGEIDESCLPDDVNYEFIGNVRFRIGSDELQESVVTYRVPNTEDGVEVDGNYEGMVGSVEIASDMPKLAKKTWLNVADTSWWAGEGNIYELSTPEQLAGMVVLMADQTTLFKNTTIVLKNDISLENNDGIMDAAGKMGERYWACSLGTSNWRLSFSGVFDGAGHKVTGLKMYPEYTYDVPSIGLFETLAGTIKNLTVEGALDARAVDNTANVVYVASSGIGGIAGYMMSGALLDNCVSRVDVYGYNYLGGLVGQINGSDAAPTIRNCVNEGTVTGTGTELGGIVGRISYQAAFEDCVNNGIVTGKGMIGGIAGRIYVPKNGTTFTRCVNNGDVYSKSASSTAQVAGIASTSNGTMVFTECYNYGNVQAVDVSGATVGGIAAHAIDSRFINCGNAGTVAAYYPYRAWVSGKTNPNLAYVGGIAGRVQSESTGSSFVGCYNAGVVNGTYACDTFDTSGTPTLLAGVGGLIGHASYGESWINIADSYSAGTLIWSYQESAPYNGAPYYPGGIIGTLDKSFTANNAPIYNTAHADSETRAGIFLSNNFVAPRSGGNIESASVSAVAYSVAAAVASDDSGIDSFVTIDPETGVPVSNTDPSSLASSDTAHIGRMKQAQNANSNNLNAAWNQYDSSLSTTELFAQAVLSALSSTFVADADSLNSGLPIHGTQKTVEVSVKDSAGKVVASVKVPAGSKLTSAYITDTLLKGNPPAYDYDANGGVPEGYWSYGTFEGWATASSGVDPSASFTMPLAGGAFTVYPVYSGVLKTYSVNYHLPEDATNNTRNPHTYTIESSFPLYDPTRPNDTFLGWYATADFSGSLVTNVARGTTGSLNFYSRWASDKSTAPMTYTITYHLNGGQNVASNPVRYTQGVGAKLANPARAGYTFEGWYETSAFTGSKVTAISTTRTGNIALWAKWKAAPVSNGQAANNVGATLTPSTANNILTSNGKNWTGVNAGSAYAGYSPVGSNGGTFDSESMEEAIEEFNTALADDDLLPTTGVSGDNAGKAAAGAESIQQALADLYMHYWLPWALVALFAVAAAAGWIAFIRNNRKKQESQYGNVK